MIWVLGRGRGSRAPEATCRTRGLAGASGFLAKASDLLKAVRDCQFKKRLWTWEGEAVHLRGELERRGGGEKQQQTKERARG